MKTEKTDNELIAEFMGFKKNVFEPEFYCLPNPFNSNGPFCSCEFLKFSNSWDWLMPVVEKIGQMTDIVYAFEIHIGVGCRIYADGKDIETFEYGIQGVYKAVVDYIKFHNSQKDIESLFVKDGE